VKDGFDNPAVERVFGLHRLARNHHWAGRQQGGHISSRQSGALKSRDGVEDHAAYPHKSIDPVVGGRVDRRRTQQNRSRGK